MEIRLVGPAECEALGRITVEAYRNLFGGEGLGGYEDELVAVAQRAADSVVLVAVDDDEQLLGGVTYVPGPGRAMSEFTDPDAAGIRMLVVRPSSQGAGIGRALTEACIAQARADGRRRIVLHSTPVMKVARGMYERLGFERAPDLDVWVTDGPYADDPLHLISYVLTL
jgi:ribosomal protein S18 acetylase RimI-like enzyme